MYSCSACIRTYLCLADLEGLVGAVDDGCGGTAAADEADALGVGRQLNGALAAHRVARVEDGRAGDGAEHGDVLQRHL